MDYDVVIIGAGVVGLAIAELLSRNDFQCLVIEQHTSFGQETSSRNSEVIHAGIYYPSNSLKTKLCVEGNRLLYEYCEKNSISHKKIGKYLIAISDEETEKLESIYQNGINNGVTGLSKVSIAEFNNQEPNIIAKAVLFSSDTGIIDSHSLMLTLENQAINNGCDFAYNHCVTELYKLPSGWKIVVKDTLNQYSSISSSFIVNSAGLNSDTIAQMAGIDFQKNNLKLNYCKGHYFKIASSKNYLAKHLIYPVTTGHHGLGIHLTVDLAGELKLGPDTLFLDTSNQDYTINPTLKMIFIKAAQRYIKNIYIDDITEDYSGIRPKLQKKDEFFRDFYIQEESEKNLAGLINLIGIESPGLTSCLSIAKFIYSIISK